MVEQANISEGAYRLTATQRLALRVYCLGLEWLGDPRQLRITDPKARRELDTLVQDIEAGNCGSRPLLLERERSFREFPAVTEGAENLPRKGPLVLAINHSNQGRLKGCCLTSVVAAEVAKVIDHGSSRRYRFTIEDRKHFLDQVSFLKGYTQRFTKPIMAQIAAVTDLIVTESGFKDLMQTIRQEGVLGIYPEGEDGRQLGEIDLRAARFLKCISTRAPVIPVGAWFNKSQKHYRVSLGPAVRYNKNQSDQEVADDIGLKIADLLPVNLQGYYRHRLSQSGLNVGKEEYGLA